MMLFQNNQIPTTALPQAETVVYHRLALSYRTVELISTAILFGILFLGWGAFYHLNKLEETWLVWATLFGWTVLTAISLYMAWKRWEVAGYALREHDIIHKHGVLFRSVTTIPFNRMQHVELSRGPIERSFGLATLRVFTAGGSSSDLSIEGLPFEEAQRIKDFITQQIGERKTVVAGHAATGDEPLATESENQPASSEI